jgi:hypothetical protein
VTQVNGSKLEVALKKVKYVYEFWINLFSINKALKNEFKLSNDSVSIRLAKDPVSLCFHCIVLTVNGFVTGCKNESKTFGNHVQLYGKLNDQ